MCKDCNCQEAGKPVQYQCACESDECSCNSIIEFDSVPNPVPFCCGMEMKRIK